MRNCRLRAKAHFRAIGQSKPLGGLQDLSRTSRKADILLLIARGTFQTMIAAWNTKLAGSEIASSLANGALPRPVSPAPICVALNQEDFLGCQGRSFPMGLRALVLAAGLCGRFRVFPRIA